MSKEVKNLTCINCPLGCQLAVTIEDDKIISVTGNTCPRGDNYAREEVTDPKRIVTSSVLVKNGERTVVSVKTKEAIPKDKIFDVVRAMRGLAIEAPVKIGSVVLNNVAGCNVDLVATANVARNS